MNISLRKHASSSTRNGSLTSHALLPRKTIIERLIFRECSLTVNFIDPWTKSSNYGANYPKNLYFLHYYLYKSLRCLLKSRCLGSSSRHDFLQSSTDYVETWMSIGYCQTQSKQLVIFFGFENSVFLFSLENTLDTI